MNKEEKLSLNVSSEQNLPSRESPEHEPRNHVTVGRRSFLRGLGIVGATLLPASAILMRQAKAQEQSSGRLTKGDADLLRFAAWAEIVESDLWVQYNELGGATKPNDGAPNVGNPLYKLALQNLDGDMPQYISDNTDDELSHAAFLNAYLISKGAEPVNLDRFRTLPGSRATGVDAAKNNKRLTNLLKLNVDVSWYTRYRSEENPDFGVIFNGPPGLIMTNEPAIPRSDADTPAGTDVTTLPFTSDAAKHIQAIADTAGFHFGFIEQGGTSLYPTLALKASSEEVLRILLSIGGVEIDHFSLWHDKAGNAVGGATGLAPLTDPQNPNGARFPDLNAVTPASALELTQTNKILPEPCDFIRTDLPPCSVIRPTSTQLGGAVATVKVFAADGLFIGHENDGFLEFAMDLATAADNARRQL